MPRLFSSFRVAPGLRISTSSRGVRAHVGPRALRAHLGGGRSGVSTGAGPFTLYQPTGGGRRSPNAANGAATPEQRHEAARRALAFIDQMHLGDVAPAARAAAPEIALPSFRKLVDTAEKSAFRGVSPVDRKARKEARRRAHAQAEAWARDLMVLAERDQANLQDALDQAWDALVGNQPQAVLKAVRHSLAATGAPASATYVSDGVLGLVVTGPALEDLPEVKPWRTARGAPTVARMNKTDTAAVTQKVISARVIVAVRQCFAAAPGLTGIAVVVVGQEDGQPRVAATFERERFERSSRGAEPASTLAACASELTSKPSRRTGDLGVIKLASGSFFAATLGKLEA